MDQKPNNSQEKDNLKESGEHLDATNGKDMKNIEEKMQKLETEGTENQKIEGQMESEKCNEAKKEEDFFVPNWLIEVLEWIKRIEMANSGLSTSSMIFHRLCEPKLHGDVEPHMVGTMQLVAESDDGTGNRQAIARYEDQILPIPNTPPPDYILGFKHISVLFLDGSVLEFIKCISSKLDGIRFVLRMDFDELSEGDERKQALQCLLNALDGRIGYFQFMWHSNFKNFNRHFSRFIDQCQCISIYGALPEFQNPEFDVLFEWLTNRQQMDGGKQKILEFIPYVEFDYFYERIKEEFSNATEPLNFLIYFLFGSSLSAEYDLNLENENTGEVFNSYRNEEFGGRLILRCPKSQEERWEKEGKQKMRMFTYFSDDETYFELDIKHFGTLTNLAENAQQE